MLKKEIKELEDKRQKILKKTNKVENLEFPYYPKKYQDSLYERCYQLLHNAYDSFLEGNDIDISMIILALNSIKKNYARVKLQETEDLKEFLKLLLEYPDLPLNLVEIIKEKIK